MPLPPAVLLLPNPHSTLSVVVSWTTDTPGSSEVSFGEDGALSWRIADPEPVTEHRVVVYGLHAERDVTLRVRTALDDGSEIVVDDLHWRTGALPPSVPAGLVTAHDPARTQPGWTLINLSNRDLGWPPTVAMYDPEGRPVWYAITATAPDDRGDLDASLTDAGTVLVGGSELAIDPVELDLAGEIVWPGPHQQVPEQHHHFQRLADGTTALLRQSPNPEREDLWLDRIEIIEPSHEVVWSWDANDHLAPPPEATGDWTHANSVTVTDDRVYLSCRNRSAIYAIDRSTGEIVWTLGDEGDFAPDPSAATPWFTWQHEPERQPDGSWLVYDNRGLGTHSRVIQLAVDEEARTTEVVWEFPGEFEVDPWYRETWFSTIWGDADRLPNGNVLIAAGTRAEGGESRVFEVTPEGGVVWEMRLPNLPELGVAGLYRAQRVAPPGLEAL